MDSTFARQPIVASVQDRAGRYMMRVVVGQPFHPGFCRRRSALTPPFVAASALPTICPMLPYNRPDWLE